MGLESGDKRRGEWNVMSRTGVVTTQDYSLQSGVADVKRFRFFTAEYWNATVDLLGRALVVEVFVQKSSFGKTRSEDPTRSTDEELRVFRGVVDGGGGYHLGPGYTGVPHRSALSDRGLVSPPNLQRGQRDCISICMHRDKMDSGVTP